MPAPSVIRAERSLHPQRREPGWLETPCPERGSCRTVGDPRLRQLAADTGDHATGRSAARFAPPWEIPRGGANRRSVDRFIPRLWGNIGPAWSPSMSIPAHPHARGEHQAASAAATIDDGSSPHPWGTLCMTTYATGNPRFIPTPVGNTLTFQMANSLCSVHPHTRGEHFCQKESPQTGGDSSPHPWGTLRQKSGITYTRRFIPTPMGNTGPGPGRRRSLPVHPHTRGEHSWRTSRSASAFGSSPHPWGTHHSLRPSSPFPRFIPTPVGNTSMNPQNKRTRSVHPHTRGEHLMSALLRITQVGSSPHPWGTLFRSKNFPSWGRFIPTPVGNTDN